MVRHQAADYLAGRRGKDLSCALHPSDCVSLLASLQKKNLRKARTSKGIPESCLLQHLQHHACSALKFNLATSVVRVKRRAMASKDYPMELQKDRDRIWYAQCHSSCFSW